MPEPSTSTHGLCLFETVGWGDTCRWQGCSRGPHSCPTGRNSLPCCSALRSLLRAEPPPTPVILSFCSLSSLPPTCIPALVQPLGTKKLLHQQTSGIFCRSQAQRGPCLGEPLWPCHVSCPHRCTPAVRGVHSHGVKLQPVDMGAGRKAFLLSPPQGLAKPLLPTPSQKPGPQGGNLSCW